MCSNDIRRDLETCRNSTYSCLCARKGEKAGTRSAEEHDQVEEHKQEEESANKFAEHGDEVVAHALRDSVNERAPHGRCRLFQIISR